MELQNVGSNRLSMRIRWVRLAVHLPLGPESDLVPVVFMAEPAATP
jgi:hypothetical protein